MNSRSYETPKGPAELAEAQPHGARPRLVAGAILILWTITGLSVISLLNKKFEFGHLMPWQIVYLSLVRIGIDVALILAVSKGQRWARSAFTILVFARLLSLLLDPSLLFGGSGSDQLLAFALPLAQVAALGLLFWPGSGRWFLAPARRLFVPTTSVILLLYSLGVVPVLANAFGNLRPKGDLLGSWLVLLSVLCKCSPDSRSCVGCTGASKTVSNVSAIRGLAILLSSWLRCVTNGLVRRPHPYRDAELTALDQP